MKCVCGKVHRREFASWRNSSRRLRRGDVPYGQKGCLGIKAIEEGVNKRFAKIQAKSQEAG
jgi:hypothetical protein